MPKPRLPAFDPKDLTESNATSYPAPFKAMNSQRWNRRLGDNAGLKNFGVNLVRIEPGGQSSARHAHAKQDEFIWVVEGEIVPLLGVPVLAMVPRINTRLSSVARGQLVHLDARSPAAEAYRLIRTSLNLGTPAELNLEPHRAPELRLEWP